MFSPKLLPSYQTGHLSHDGSSRRVSAPSRGSLEEELEIDGLALKLELLKKAKKLLLYCRTSSANEETLTRYFIFHGWRCLASLFAFVASLI
jgi:hypothetical protein